MYGGGEDLRQLNLKSKNNVLSRRWGWFEVAESEVQKMSKTWGSGEVDIW